MDIAISIDGIPSGGFFDAWGRYYKSELRSAEADIKRELLKEARNNHRYKSQTGKLQNATKVRGGLDQRETLELYIDLNAAPHGEFIIKGARGNAPDDFLTKALRTKKSWITNRLQQAADKATIRFNRQK